MSTIVTRSGKGSPLTNTEVDSNFTNLNTDKAELSGADFTGAITTTSTVDGRDVAVDGTKLDGVEASADVTDVTNVTASGALMDSEVTNLAQVKAFDSTDYATAAQGTLADAALPKTGGAVTGPITSTSTFDGRDVATDGTKLDGVEASADVTDATNVTAAGALMDSELTSIASVKALNQGVATGDSPTFVNVVATSLDISGDIDVDGTTNLDVVDIDGAVDMASTLAVAGVVTANAGVVVDNITIDGTQIDLSSGDLTLDVAGDIILDAAGEQVKLNYQGDTHGELSYSSQNFVIKSTVSDKDLIFKGNDGGSEITALTLDMSAAGAATFNAGVTATTGQFGTSLNVDGTATMDGLTVGDTSSGQSIIQMLANPTSGANTIHFGDGAGASAYQGYINYAHGTDELQLATAGTPRLKIATDGSLSTPTLGTSNVRFGVNAGNSIVSGGNYNVLVGDEAGTAITTGSANIALGHGALKTEDTASHNTAIGFSSLGLNNGGLYNVAVGNYSLDANTTASNNTAVGYASLGANTTGTRNSALGVVSLNLNTTGNDNSAYGYAALGVNTTGSNNTAMGVDALDANTTASNNTAVGYKSLSANTTGLYNTASGAYALQANTTANSNTAMGYVALYANTTGTSNTAVGINALDANTSGSENVALGSGALGANTTANDNTAVGGGALGANTTGADNTAIGRVALVANTTGANNVAIGRNALLANTTGASNTANGYGSLITNTTGVQNTALGVSALHSNITGSHNLGVGASAGYYVTGSGNITIGARNNAGTYAPVNDITSQNNYLSMGHTAVTNAYVKVAWTVTSDARDKSNFADVPHGLSFVNQLTPYSYEFKLDRDEEETDGIVRYGFKAQDILALEGDNPVIIDNEDPNSLRYRETALIPILVKAIQELTARITTLEG